MEDLSETGFFSIQDADVAAFAPEVYPRLLTPNLSLWDIGPFPITTGYRSSFNNVKNWTDVFNRLKSLGIKDAVLEASIVWDVPWEIIVVVCGIESSGMNKPVTPSGMGGLMNWKAAYFPSFVKDIFENKDNESRVPKIVYDRFESKGILSKSSTGVYKVVVTPDQARRFVDDLSVAIFFGTFLLYNIIKKNHWSSSHSRIFMDRVIARYNMGRASFPENAIMKNKDRYASTKEFVSLLPEESKAFVEKMYGLDGGLSFLISNKIKGYDIHEWL